MNSTLKILGISLFLLLNGCATLEHKILCQMPATWCDFDQALKLQQQEQEEINKKIHHKKEVFTNNKLQVVELYCLDENPKVNLIAVKETLAKAGYSLTDEDNLEKYPLAVMIDNISCSISDTSGSPFLVIECYVRWPNSKGSAHKAYTEYDPRVGGYPGIIEWLDKLRDEIRAEMRK